MIRYFRDDKRTESKNMKRGRESIVTMRYEGVSPPLCLFVCRDVIHKIVLVLPRGLV